MVPKPLKVNAEFSPTYILDSKKNPKFFAETRTPDTPTDQKNISLLHLFHKIYSKAMPAQKYISKV
jgi:hypothetical protein